jgi:hypothetical protein
MLTLSIEIGIQAAMWVADKKEMTGSVWDTLSLRYVCDVQVEPSFCWSGD